MASERKGVIVIALPISLNHEIRLAAKVSTFVGFIEFSKT